VQFSNHLIGSFWLLEPANRELPGLGILLWRVRSRPRPGTPIFLARSRLL